MQQSRNKRNRLIKRPEGAKKRWQRNDFTGVSQGQVTTRRVLSSLRNGRHTQNRSSQQRQVNPVTADAGISRNHAGFRGSCKARKCGMEGLDLLSEQYSHKSY